MGFFSKILPLSGYTEQLVAVFDVGSSSICAALFLTRANGVPKLVYSVREPISPMGEVNIDDFLSLAIKALDVAAAKLSTSPFGAPSKIYCGLASPWYVSQNRVIRLEKTVPFIFTPKVADGLIEKEIKLFEEQHLHKYIESGINVRPIELKNIKTILNGYEIANPENQKAKEVEMTMFVSMSGEDILSQIEDTIFQHFHTKEVKFFSFLMASFTVVRDLYHDQHDFLLVDIGGEVTDISMVKKDLLQESVSYPIGRNFMIRGLAEKLGCDLDEAKTMLSMYKDEHADADVVKKIEPVLNNLKGEWLRRFQTSLANLSKDISIPATIFITVDKEYADFFSDIIKTEQFNQYTLTESKFQIIFLNTEKLHGVAIFEDSAIRDTFLIIDAIYINRFLSHK